MEIELEVKRMPMLIGAFLIVLAVMVGLGALGKSLAPDRLLTWTEWQILKEERAYDRELAALRRQTEALAEILDGNPDAVRGQWLYEETLRLVNEQRVEALEPERQAVLQAAQAVRDWSLGQIPKEQAIHALEQAVRELEK